MPIGDAALRHFSHRALRTTCECAVRWLYLAALPAAFGLALTACASVDGALPGPSAATTPHRPDTAVNRKPSKPVVALALGGGAARGFAHIGVIQVLEQAGIRPDIVVGTSSGSLVATLYAGGKNGSQLQALAADMDEYLIADWGVPLVGRGMLRGAALAAYVNQQIGLRPIQDLPVRLGIVAVNLHNGASILFQRGDAGSAVRASSAVPGVFEPVRIAGVDYVDGGLASPIPVSQAKRMGATVVVAVDVSTPPADEVASNSLSILLKTFSIMGKHLGQWELAQADVVVRPQLVGLKNTDFASKQKSIEQGRIAMRAALPALHKALLSWQPG